MLLLDAVQTAVVLIGGAYGAYQVADLKRARHATSLDSLLREWRDCADDRRLVLRGFPALDGSLPQQLRGFLDWMGAQDEAELERLLTSARRTTNALNDLGAYLESGAISKRLFFAQTGTQVLELAHLLDPFILLTCARRGSRWGLRVRRVRWGASSYYATSRVHKDETVSRSGVVIWPLAASVPAPRTSWGRARLIPSKEACLEADTEAVAAAAAALAACPASASGTSVLD